ncbi:hypothetical protein ILYODFUR_014310 [Ilyodon furcidens]|uniref:Uncharacterized protein n=1 Tax=Ilyodon furcidens TaxID=33524 RepID=A0ABV0U5C4_9TELE
MNGRLVTVTEKRVATLVTYVSFGSVHLYILSYYSYFNSLKQVRRENWGSGGRGSFCDQWDTSPALPADGGQRAWWNRLYGSHTSVSLPQGCCGNNTVFI